MEPFGARLRLATAERGPLCVGIDPHPALLADWGLADDADGLATFSRTVVDALAGRVAVLKPQSAFFERHGVAGLRVLADTISSARAAGCLVVLDVKRGDIGSTAQAYADAYLAPGGDLAADAITVSPYLGFGSVRPFVDTALTHGAGVIVLALTSNPEGAQVQRAVGPDGRTVAQTVLDEIAAVNADVRPLGSIGAVVGATLGDTGHDLSRVNGPLLAPGLGAQGATASDLRTVFGAALPDVLPSVSREVLRAGPDPAALLAAADVQATTLSAVLTD